MIGNLRNVEKLKFGQPPYNDYVGNDSGQLFVNRISLQVSSLDTGVTETISLQSSTGVDRRSDHTLRWLLFFSVSNALPWGFKMRK